MLLIFCGGGKAKLSVGLSSHGLFVDKTAALRKAYPKGTHIHFIVGFDTIIRVLDKRYYDDREKALEQLFSGCSFLAANRGAKSVSDIQELFEMDENKKYARRVKTFVISDSLAAISSTQIRDRVEGGRSIADLVPAEIEQFVSETALYAPQVSVAEERISVYGVRSHAVEYLWALDPEKPAEVDLKRIISVATKDTSLGKEVRRVIELHKNEIPRRPAPSTPTRLVGNFDLVTPLFSLQEAQQEANRCLRCEQRRCERHCLPGLPIAELLTFVAQGEFARAYLTMREAELLCGLTEYLCQTKENYCERYCLSRELFGAGNEIAIQTVLRTVWEYGRGRFEGRLWEGKKGKEACGSRSERVAIVGSGPAGLRAAMDLVKLGYRVTLFERKEKIGGIPRYETPIFRFPAEKVFRQIEEDIQALSIETVNERTVGVDVTIDDLKNEGCAAIFVATGLTVPKKLDLLGEDVDGVLTSIDLFARFLKDGADDLMIEFKGKILEPRPSTSGYD